MGWLYRRQAREGERVVVVAVRMVSRLCMTAITAADAAKRPASPVPANAGLHAIPSPRHHQRGLLPRPGSFPRPNGFFSARPPFALASRVASRAGSTLAAGWLRLHTYNVHTVSCTVLSRLW